MQIIESPFLTEQYRFPRTKNRRIRRKWAKREENWRPITNRAYQIGGMIVCSPQWAQLLRELPYTTPLYDHHT